MRVVPLAALVAAGALAAGCTTGDSASRDHSAPTVDAARPSAVPTLAGLPTCPPPPSPSAPPVRDVPLPVGAVVTDVQTTGPVVQVQGYVGRTPVEVRAEYAQREGLRILLIEDEVYEAEVLATDGDSRVFIKARAVCQRGSQFVAVSADESAAGAVPAPAGAAGAAPRP